MASAELLSVKERARQRANLFRASRAALLNSAHVPSGGAATIRTDKTVLPAHF